jgi:uncharacterized membrane protein YjgN (DUF898 family)
MQTNSKRFTFDGGAATYLGTAILGIVLTVFTLGIMYPFALVLRERWKAKHSYIDGKRLVFTGSAMGLFGRWLLWLLLIIVTLGVYSFWVRPRIQKWKWEHTDFLNL